MLFYVPHLSSESPVTEAFPDVPRLQILPGFSGPMLFYVPHLSSEQTLFNF